MLGLLYNIVIVGRTLPFNSSDVGDKYTYNIYIFVDNFYTRHIFAKELLAFSHGKLRTIGTISKQNVGTLNAPYIEKSYRELSSEKKVVYVIVCVHMTLEDTVTPKPTKCKTTPVLGSTTISKTLQPLITTNNIVTKHNFLLIPCTSYGKILKILCCTQMTVTLT